MVMESLKVLIAHSNAETRTTIEQGVQELGHQILGTAITGQEILNVCQEKRPDIVISGVHLPDFDGIRALTLIGRERPVPGIIVTPKTDLELVETASLDHIMAWLVEPVRMIDLGPTMLLVYRRGQEFSALRQENRDLKAALVDRKLIERAKGILMETGGLSESEAFKQLQKLANAKRIKLIDMARSIIQAKGTLETMDHEETV